MDVTVRGKNCRVPSSIRELAGEKLARVERVAHDASRASIEFVETGHHHSPLVTECEITVHLRKQIVRAHASGTDLVSALDVAVDKLEHQVTRLKDKRVTRAHGGRRHQGADNGNGSGNGAAPLADVVTDADPDDSADDGLRIVREKNFDSKPMTPEEAALQMDLLGHDFFLFSNSENGNAAVIYRRRDGDLGLIETPG